MPRNPRELLQEARVRLTHMLESARRALRIADGLTEFTLQKDEVRLLAIVKSIEIIGEASIKVSDNTCARLSNLPWRGIRAMRNRMVHGYDAINVAIVWRTLEEHIPPLIRDLGLALANWPSE